MSTLFVGSIECEAIEKPLYCHIHGLIQTTSGYGMKLATSKMIWYNGKFRRVYCCIFSNSGVYFIGKNIRDGLIVRDYPYND